ncbi:hypothetical protein [Burkholderia multivorans]|uniref:hypothetical protein n=1 Tax=Burkholderia multivorans TaxID=87883 RepID=UPI001C24B254|nr:hypothetical protein [Burkholderia multivorans]MBU9607142.1 hypothetical protein [Burkholderia multivorans]MBU9625173.1 hypothetical protein [Burkholderia multivorans]
MVGEGRHIETNSAIFLRKRRYQTNFARQLDGDTYHFAVLWLVLDPVSPARLRTTAADRAPIAKEKGMNRGGNSQPPATVREWTDCGSALAS